jgi:uncharacterized protein YaiE (UPF0345 family)
MGRVYCLYSGSDGQSRLVEETLRLDVESLGRVSTGMLAARGWMFGVTQHERFVDWHTAGPGGLSVLLEGSMEMEVGNGDRCIAVPGDLVFALDTRGQGHRTRMSKNSRGLTVALDGEPEALMQKLFGRVLSD